MSEPAASPFLRPGLVTAAAAALLGVAVATLGALLATGTGPGAVETVRAGARAWLVAQGSGLQVAGGEVGLVPIGAALLVLGLTALVASRVVREPLEGPGPFAATVAGVGGVLAAIVSVSSGSGQVGTSEVRAAFGAFVVAGLGAALGATLPHGRTSDLWPTDRADARAVVRGSAWGAVTLLGTAAVVLVVLLTRGIGRAADLWAALDPGVAGGVVLALLCLLAVPTALLWTVSVLLGPGFALGAGTSVDLSGAQLGPVPGLPLLAALPSPGAFGSWAFLLGLAPLLAGVVAGWRTPVVGRATSSLLHRALHGALAGGLAGLVVGVAVGLSGGAVGPGRMAEAGPPVLTPLAVAVPVLAVGGALGALLAHYRGLRAQQPRDASTPRRPRLRQRHQPPGPDRRGRAS